MYFTPDYSIRVFCYLVMAKMGIPNAYRSLPVFLITFVVALPVARIVNRYMPFVIGKGKKRE